MQHSPGALQLCAAVSPVFKYWLLEELRGVLFHSLGIRFVKGHKETAVWKNSLSCAHYANHRGTTGQRAAFDDDDDDDASHR